MTRLYSFHLIFVSDVLHKESNIPDACISKPTVYIFIYLVYTYLSIFVSISMSVYDQ